MQGLFKMQGKKLVFWIVIVGSQLLLAEVLLQTHYRVTAGDWLFNRVGLAMFEPDEHRFYRVQPNLSYHHLTNEFDVTYYTDKFGLRSDSDHEFVPKKKAGGVYRVLFMGPSFNFGIAGNYEDIYVTLIGNKLQAQGKRVEFINLGTPAQPPAQQLCWVDAVGREYDFDMVVQTVYGDPAMITTQCVPPDEKFTFEGGYIFKGMPTMRERFIGTAKQSAIIFYGWFIYQAIVTSEPSTDGMGTEFYDQEKASAAEAVQNAPAFFESYVDNMRGALQNDAEVVFLHIPYSYVVRPADVSRWSHMDNLDPLAAREEAAAVAEMLTDTPVNYINPMDSLVQRDAVDRTYYFLNIHFTPAGNQAVAEAATPEIQRYIDAHLARRSAGDS